MQDHAYYLEMRDRSGFDFDANGQADRGAADFQAGLYLSYTDEAHGYGNVGTDDPPAQSPLDSVPEPGSETPNLNDAAFTAGAGRSSYSDSGAGHTDNYTDPSTESGNWEFKYGCLGFNVTSMSGDDAGPEEADGNLTGDVAFTIGSGCGDFNYGYPPDPPGGNTAPTAVATATPSSAAIGTERDALGGRKYRCRDSEQPDLQLGLRRRWHHQGRHRQDRRARLPQGRHVRREGDRLRPGRSHRHCQRHGDDHPGRWTGLHGPVAHIRVKPKHPGVDRKVRFVGKKSTGTGALTYAWNFHNGGKKVDGTGKKVKTFVRRVGRHKVTLTITDSTGATAKATVRYRVRSHYSNRSMVDVHRLRGLVSLW